MMHVHYRKASQQDFETITDILATNIDLSVFTSVRDKDALAHLATIYIANDFKSSTFIEIAEHDEKICGIILGSTTLTNEKAVEFDYEAAVKKAKATLQTTASGQQVLSDLKQQKLLSQTVEHDCDSKLLFFCVDKKYRRHQIGTTLIHAFEKYLSNLNAKGYSLHTDTNCSYQYYENNGYQRIETCINRFDPQVEHYTYIKILASNPQLDINKKHA